MMSIFWSLYSSLTTRVCLVCACWDERAAVGLVQKIWKDFVLCDHTLSPKEKSSELEASTSIATLRSFYVNVAVHG